jgi:hypothetical protein
MPSRIMPHAEDIIASAMKAIDSVLEEWGVPRPAVVINVVWQESPSDDDLFTTFAMGSRAPSRYRKMMAESLRASAEEAEG